MALYEDYGYTQVAGDVSLTHESEDQYTRIVPVHAYEEIVLTYDVTIGLTGGSSPGVKFTVEGDVSGEGEWIALSTLVADTNGYAADGPADPTITSTGKAYRRYGGLVGMNLRIKIEVTGTPTGGTATINNIYLIARR